jgi:hypothetical protein
MILSLKLKALQMKLWTRAAYHTMHDSEPHIMHSDAAVFVLGVLMQ